MPNVSHPLAEQPTGPRWSVRALLALTMSVLLTASWGSPVSADVARQDGVRPPNCDTPNTPPCGVPQIRSTMLVALPSPPHAPIIKG